ncbi:MAG: hypothetical protein JWO36_7360 [Myxococcales bacterium]|nr:hypothetical protein [Myxococcales bacterium]
MIALRGLAPFTAPSATRTRSPSEAICELCASPLGAHHRHVVEIGVRGVQCTCQACAILFSRSDSETRFRTVPDRVLGDPAFAMTTSRWVELGIPVGLAFCFFDSASGHAVISYPGPAGVTEAELEPAVWEAIVAATPLAAQLERDVEAILVHGERGAPTMACYLVPISSAYELAGRLRTCWRGFSGGDEAAREIAAFFADLDRRGGVK